MTETISCHFVHYINTLPCQSLPSPSRLLSLSSPTGIVVNNYQLNTGSKDDLAQIAADEAERASRELMYSNIRK